MNKPKRHTQITKNSNAVDYHLLILGFEERDDYEFISRDDVIFGSHLLKAKPDFVIKQKNTSNYIVIQYKSRKLGLQEVTKYEMTQALIDSLAVKYHFSENKQDINVYPVLMYGDGQRRKVEYDQNDVDMINNVIVEAAPDGGQVSSSELAAIIAGYRDVDTEYKSPTQSTFTAGTRMHEELVNTGPKC